MLDLTPAEWTAILLSLRVAVIATLVATPFGIALAASVAWSVAVWWFGEGLGGVLNGGANPLSGAPGAVIVYALVAVLLWPADRTGTSPAPFTAARAVGGQAARFLWLVFWLSQCYFMLTPANRAPQATSAMIAAACSVPLRKNPGMSRVLIGSINSLMWCFARTSAA